MVIDPVPIALAVTAPDATVAAALEILKAPPELKVTPPENVFPALLKKTA
jgi:hypothetical protein